MSDEYLLNIDKIYYFLIKKCSFTCVCAFFVVPLQPHSVKSAPLAYEARRGICFREASENLAQTRCCDLQCRLYRI